MPLGVGHRLAGGFAAMWLAISLAFPSALRVCPTHSVPPAASIAVSASDDAGHVGHTAAATAAAHDDHDGECDCLTNCCLPTPFASPRPISVAAAEPDAAGNESRPTDALSSALRREHAAPFATAPPGAHA